MRKFYFAKLRPQRRYWYIQQSDHVNKVTETLRSLVILTSLLIA